MSTRPPSTTALALADRYDALLLDAYGVIVAHDGALPGARALIAKLQERGRAFFIVTNDASRTPAGCARFYREVGLDIAEEQVISSGSLLAGYFQEHGLAGARCVVLGPADSRSLVEDAGGQLVAADDEELDVLVVADEAGYPFLETLDTVLTTLFRALDRGRDVRLVLPNPDRLYPKGGDAFGFAAGSVAALLEDAVARRYRDAAPTFLRLGKPHRPIFDEAEARAGSRDLVMLGDQVATDIRGARDAGLAAALVEGGVDRWSPEVEVAPDWLVTSLVDPES